MGGYLGVREIDVDCKCGLKSVEPGQHVNA
jgi:hypothetical protein